MSLLHRSLNQEAIPKNLSYLELGLGFYNEIPWFNHLQFKNKISVDLIDLRADYVGSTDQFFLSNSKKFDIIYIDAFHQLDFIIRDFNNSLICLNTNGKIFIHDLYPPNETYVSPKACGNGYPLLKYFLDNDFKFKFSPDDHGLTCIYGNFKPIFNVKDIPYSDFIQIDFNEYSLDYNSFLNFVSSIFNENSI